jgi:hypothetical protein
MEGPGAGGVRLHEPQRAAPDLREAALRPHSRESMWVSCELREAVFGASWGSSGAPIAATVAPMFLASLALGLCGSSARFPRRLASIVALGAILSPASCFDSDEKYQPAAEATTTTGPSITTTSDGTSSTGSSSTTEAPEQTCRDAIECVVGCATELQAAMLPEPDLTCFLECEEGLTTEEVLHLFRLTECVTNQCMAQGRCDILVPMDTSTGESSSSGGDSSSTGDTDGTRPPECLFCILGAMMDPQPPGCQEFASACV